MKIWNTAVSSLSEADQIYVLLFGTFLGLGTTLHLLSPFGMISGSHIEFIFGFVSLSMSACIGGVFWRRNRSLFVSMS